MPSLSYTTASFVTAPHAQAPPADGVLDVSRAELIWAAITVGAIPTQLGGHPRPLLELCWRAALVEANLTPAPPSARGRMPSPGRQWARSAAFTRLDPTEKAAVNYFLGMVQAKVTCARLLTVDHLMHLDACLSYLGRPARATRPDLLGRERHPQGRTVVVEAKGTSRTRHNTVTTAAKTQARALHWVSGTASVLPVASVAWFDGQGRWNAHLEDPPPPSDSETPIDLGELLDAYYRPLAAAIRQAGPREDRSHTYAELTDIDLTLGLPTQLYRLLGGASEQLDYTSAPGISTELTAIIADIDNIAYTRQGRPDFADVGPSAPRHTGRDGVHIELGDTWLDG